METCEGCPVANDNQGSKPWRVGGPPVYRKYPNDSCRKRAGDCHLTDETIIDAMLRGRVKISNPHFRNPATGTTKYDLYVVEDGYEVPWQERKED